ncbi:50S ribosomal protein L24 [Candidatus Roizmanbacteria bacterium]|nr:50S ribosomal protein L24 [Candidatus Roizmanbacteria bacterium]
MRIRKGDKVRVITGKDRGREGVVERVYAKQQRIFLPGINLFKKHIKKSEQTPQGGVVELPRPVPVSNVMLICPKCKKTTRVAYRVESGKKFRMCKRCKSKI